MAKQKSGLGRGLNALFEDTSRSVVQKPVKEEVKAEPTIVDKKKTPSTTPAASAPQEKKTTAAKPEKAPSKTIEAKASDIYISEDAIEHAKVVSREARKPTHRVAAPSRTVDTGSFTTRKPLHPTSSGAASTKASVKPVTVRPSATTAVPEKKAASSNVPVPAKPAAKANPAPKKPEKGEIGLVPVDKIQPNPDQPRTNFKQEEIEELASSIKKEGLLQPILVRRVGDHYEIIAGERRWQACKNLNMKEIPVRFWFADNDKALELALIENIQRTDLNPIEEAYGYKRLMERKNMTQSELAQTVSKGRSTIANALRLLDLPEDAQQLLFEEKITAGHARAILSIPDAEGRKTLTKKLVEQKLSVRETESIARLLSGRVKAAETGATKRIPAPASFKKAAKGLTRYLSVPVRVKTVQGKNKIEIQFKDEEELQRIIGLISNIQNATEKDSVKDAAESAE